MINADQILPPPHSVSVKPRVPDRPINGIHSPATRSTVAMASTAEPSASFPWTGRQQREKADGSHFLDSRGGRTLAGPTTPPFDSRRLRLSSSIPQFTLNGLG